MGPTLLCLVPGIPRKILSGIPRGSASLILAYVLINSIDRFKQLILSAIADIRWSFNIVRHFGLYTLLENQWTRLQVPQVDLQH